MTMEMQIITETPVIIVTTATTAQSRLPVCSTGNSVDGNWSSAGGVDDGMSSSMTGARSGRWLDVAVSRDRFRHDR